MNHSTLDLRGAVAALAAIDRAGWLADLENAVFAATRGPRDDFHRFPELRFDAERLATVVARLLGLPIDDCREAAREELLPWTRRRAALAVIAEFVARIEGAALADATAAKLTRERARRRA